MEILINAAKMILVVMFFVGLAGSAVVIVISFGEDLVELMHSDEHGNTDGPVHAVPQ
jgi:hypothetical protein